MSDEKKEESNKPVFGEWQRCPCCDNNGQIWLPVIIGGYPSTTGMTYPQICTVCHGAKIIQRPIIKP